MQSGESHATYRTFLNQFGSDETIVVGVRMADGLTPPLTRWMQDVTAALRVLPHIEEVRSLATAKRLRRTFFGGLVEQPLFPDEKTGTRIRPAFPSASSPEEPL